MHQRAVNAPLKRLSQLSLSHEPKICSVTRSSFSGTKFPSLQVALLLSALLTTRPTPSGPSTAFARAYYRTIVVAVVVVVVKERVKNSSLDFNLIHKVRFSDKIKFLLLKLSNFHNVIKF